jgi:hypothetical protein
MGQTACADGCSDLTSDTDCGACGHACGAGSSCTSGYCAPVTVCTGTGDDNIASLGTTAFIADGQELVTCDLTQTNAVATVFSKSALNGFSYTHVGADSHDVYVLSHVVTFNSNTLSETTGTSSPLDDVYDASKGAATLIVDAQKGFVYMGYPTSIDRVLLAQATDAGVPTYSCVPNIGMFLGAAAGGGKLLYADGATNTISWETVTLNNCSAATTLASGLDLPGALVTDGTIAAFADVNGVYACNVTLGCVPQTTPTPLAANQGAVSQVVIDDTVTPPNLYWAGAAGLVKCSSDPTVCKGSPTVLLPNITSTGLAGLLVQGASVYYLQGGVLYRVAK